MIWWFHMGWLAVVIAWVFIVVGVLWATVLPTIGLLWSLGWLK